MVHHGPRPLVLCGPSGSGKSTLIKRLFDQYPGKFGFSVSHTTRKARPGEVDGKDYHFTDLESMKTAISQGDFIESATFSGNMYGTSKEAVESVRGSGKMCILDIEMEGVKQVKNTDLDPLFVFVKPPSMEELERRLRARNTETEESLQKRLETARKEMEYGEITDNFHIIIENENVDKAYADFLKFVQNHLKQEKQDEPAAE